MKKYKTIEEFLSDLSEDKLAQVTALRQIILSAIPVTEHIKWNAPSYVLDNEDRVTFNMHGENIKVLIHMGATRKEDKKAQPVLEDSSGLISWNSNIRGTITFEDMNDIVIKQADFINILKQWAAIELH